MTGPPLFDLDPNVGVHAVDDAGSDDAVDDGAREQVGRGRASEGHVLVAALQHGRVGHVPYRHAHTSQFFL